MWRLSMIVLLALAWPLLGLAQDVLQIEEAYGDRPARGGPTCPRKPDGWIQWW